MNACVKVYDLGVEENGNELKLECQEPKKGERKHFVQLIGYKNDHLPAPTSESLSTYYVLEIVTGLIFPDWNSTHSDRIGDEYLRNDHRKETETF